MFVVHFYSSPSVGLNKKINFFSRLHVEKKVSENAGNYGFFSKARQKKNCFFFKITNFRKIQFFLYLLNNFYFIKEQKIVINCFLFWTIVILLTFILRLFYQRNLKILIKIFRNIFIYTYIWYVYYVKFSCIFFL